MASGKERVVERDRERETVREKERPRRGYTCYVKPAERQQRVLQYELHFPNTPPSCPNACKSSQPQWLIITLHQDVTALTARGVQWLSKVC